MKTILFCAAFFLAVNTLAQPRAEGFRDSLNGYLKSFTVTFFKVKKNANGETSLERDYFSHHQEFVYNENNILIKRNFYEDKKKITEERDMIAFKKLPAGIKYDTSYNSTDTAFEMLVTRYKEGKITEYIRHQTVKLNGDHYLVYFNPDKKMTFYRYTTKTAEGFDRLIWQESSDYPINLNNLPNIVEKYNNKGHLRLKVINLKNGDQKSSGRFYKYDPWDNPVWIQFNEWNPATDKFEPVSEELYEYTYRKPGGKKK